MQGQLRLLLRRGIVILRLRRLLVRCQAAAAGLLLVWCQAAAAGLLLRRLRRLLVWV